MADIELRIAARNMLKVMESIWDTKGRDDDWISDEMGLVLSDAYFNLRDTLEKLQMVRESNYRIHRELQETRQRPHAPPSAPRRGLKVRTGLVVMAWLVGLAVAYSFAREMLG